MSVVARMPCANTFGSNVYSVSAMSAAFIPKSFFVHKKTIVPSDIVNKIIGIRPYVNNSRGFLLFTKKNFRVNSIMFLLFQLSSKVSFGFRISSGSPSKKCISGGCSVFILKSPVIIFEYPAAMCCGSSQVIDVYFSEINSSAASRIIRSAAVPIAVVGFIVLR